MKKMNSGQIRFRAETDTKINALLGHFPEFERSDRAEIFRDGRYGNSAADEWLDLPKDVRAECWTTRPNLV